VKTTSVFAANPLSSRARRMRPTLASVCTIKNLSQ
jgi:hypothetical protein